MQESFDYDLFVIGGGSAGVRAARMAAQRGARVALAEAAQLGGTCVNLGCIPKKLYSYAAHYGEAFEEAAGYGWQVEGHPTLDWATLKARRAQEISRLNSIYRGLLDKAGVHILQDWAQLTDAHTVQLAGSGQRVSARHILVATGGRPHVPNIPGRELVITSNDMFDLEPLPKRLLVVGGGYIASEFASIFQGLGAQVTQLYRGTRILRGFDAEIASFVATEMQKKGVQLRLQADITAVRRGSTGLRATLQNGEVLEADAVLYATGRVPLVQGLGLEAAGVRLSDKGAIAVDAQYRTSVPSILAAGDVTARVQLTPVALAEAMVIVDTLFGAGTRTLDYDFIPTAVFTHPSIGTVGYTEEAARERFGGDDIRVFRSEFKALRHTLSNSTERTLMKLVVQTSTDRVVGLHMVGAEAGEIVQGFAVALRAGATKAVFDSTIGIHPTAAEEFVTMRE
jgi:glutathione reductase (NADPH)